MRYLAVVQRYSANVVHESDSLSEALKEYDSEEHFFVGVLDTVNYVLYFPTVTAIGFGVGQAIEIIKDATNIIPRTVKLFSATDKGWSFQ